MKLQPKPTNDHGTSEKPPFRKIGRCIVKGLLGLLALGLALQLLWNFVVSPLFALPLMAYWQAVGGVLLARLIAHLFGLSIGRNCKPDAEKRSSCCFRPSRRSDAQSA